MLDEAEQVFTQIASKLQSQNLHLSQVFGQEDMIHVLPHYESDTEVKVMTADDF
jgi:hypothetical protein